MIFRMIADFTFEAESIDDAFRLLEKQLSTVGENNETGTSFEGSIRIRPQEIEQIVSLPGDYNIPENKWWENRVAE